MKPLYILVEGQTEEEFVKEVLRPYFAEKQIHEVTPIKISTKAGFKGGFVKYGHLKRDANNLLKQRSDILVSSFVDYFRIPNDVPNYEKCLEIHSIDNRIECLENAIKNDVNNERFYPYIQKHEFEAVLFSNNKGFDSYYDSKIGKQTAKIISKYINPEEINDSPQSSPSNRLKVIVPQYNKVLSGNIIALEVGIENIIEKCPRFAQWIDILVGLSTAH